MDETERLDPETVAAMLAIVVDRVPADDAWVAYVRARHPEAAEELARLALTEVALELLVGRGHVSPAEAARQREAASGEAATRVRRAVWQEIHRMKRMLDKLEAMEDRDRETTSGRLIVLEGGTLVDVDDEAAETDEATHASRTRSA